MKKKITAVKDNKYTRKAIEETGWSSDSVLNQRLGEIRFREESLIFLAYVKRGIK